MTLTVPAHSCCKSLIDDCSAPSASALSSLPPPLPIQHQIAAPVSQSPSKCTCFWLKKIAKKRPFIVKYAAPPESFCWLMVFSISYVVSIISLYLLRTIRMQNHEPHFPRDSGSKLRIHIDRSRYFLIIDTARCSRDGTASRRRGHGGRRCPPPDDAAIAPPLEAAGSVPPLQADATAGVASDGCCCGLGGSVEATAAAVAFNADTNNGGIVIGIGDEGGLTSGSILYFARSLLHSSANCLGGTCAPGNMLCLS